MKLAYFSPLRPQPSAVSDYSAALLPQLATGAEIDLFVDGFTPSSAALRAAHRWFDYQKTPAVLHRLREYDAILYHMGNDHRYHAGIYQTACAFPGIVLLHDYDLHDFFYGLARANHNLPLYYDEIAACADPAAPPAAALRSSLNCRIARNAEALIVHSAWSRTRLSRIAPAVPIAHINHPAPQQLNNDHEFALASFEQPTPQHSIEQHAKEILDFIRYVLAQRIRRHFVRKISAELAQLDPAQTNDAFLRRVAAEIAQLTPAEIFAPPATD